MIKSSYDYETRSFYVSCNFVILCISEDSGEVYVNTADGKRSNFIKLVNCQLSLNKSGMPLIVNYVY